MKQIPRDGIWLSKEILVRVITCLDHSSAAWKRMMWCSEIRVFSHCIRLFSLVGGQEACSAFGRHLLLRLCLTTGVYPALTHLLQINPPWTALQAQRSPSVLIHPAGSVSQGLLITSIYIWALLPSHRWSGKTPANRERRSLCTFSNFFTFLFPTAVNIRGFPQKICHCLRVCIEGQFFTSIRDCSSCKDVWAPLSGKNHRRHHAHPQPAPLSSPLRAPSSTPSAMPG